MYSKLGIVIVLLLLPVQMTSAIIIYVRQPLNQWVERANIVAHVRITRVEDRRFSLKGEEWSCGKDYFVDVLTTFKGRPLSQRVFSAPGEPHGVLFHEVKPGDELLVLLVARKREYSPDGDGGDVIDTTTRAEIQCRSRLSHFMLLSGPTGGFPLIMRNDRAWLAYSSARFEMPQSLKRDEVLYNVDCKGMECGKASRRMVPWESLQAQIRHWVGVALHK